MNKTEYPCGSCAQERRSNCKNCPAWRQWYFYRQSLINAYAQRIRQYWRYDLPLHPTERKH